MDVYESAAKGFLELASDQRLNILFTLLEKKTKVSPVAKELNATIQHVHKNFQRLTDAHLIAKEGDGYYRLTAFGEIVCTQIPSMFFLSKNMKYFSDHNFGDIPKKFVMRIGALVGGQQINGFANILEKWKTIFENANKYIYGILIEEPLDLIKPIVRKAEEGIKINSIFSESAIIPKGRKQILEKLGFKKLLEKGAVERKMKKDVKVVVVLNEKEACVMFPRISDEPDLSKMFYGNDSLFHEWCLDYFRYCWYGSEIFQERRLKEE